MFLHYQSDYPSLTPIILCLHCHYSQTLTVAAVDETDYELWMDALSDTLEIREMAVQVRADSTHLVRLYGSVSFFFCVSLSLSLSVSSCSLLIFLNFSRKHTFTLLHTNSLLIIHLTQTSLTKTPPIFEFFRMDSTVALTLTKLPEVYRRKREPLRE